MEYFMACTVFVYSPQYANDMQCSSFLSSVAATTEKATRTGIGKEDQCRGQLSQAWGKQIGIPCSVSIVLTAVLVMANH